MLAMLTSNPAQSCYSATPLESQHTLKRARATQANDSKGYDKYKARFRALQPRVRDDQDEADVEPAEASPARKRARIVAMETEDAVSE